MSTETAYDFDVLAIRRRLGRDRWGPPRQMAMLGPTSVVFTRSDGARTVIVTSSPIEGAADDTVWLHASIAVQPDGERTPDYYELVDLHRAVWGDSGWAIQVFVPPAAHINIRANALHLWGRLDGQRVHPDFGWAGTI